MGIDLYAYSTAKKVRATGCEIPRDETALFYCHNHYRLHAWMLGRYHAKVGSRHVPEMFSLRLDVADLNDLEETIRQGEMPKANGVTLQRGVEKPADDQEFIRKARRAIARGRRVCIVIW